MKEKGSYIVVTFGTTADALAMDQVGKRSGLSGRLIPVPRQLSAGCGLAWREPRENKNLLCRMLAAEEVGFDGMHEMEL